MTNQQKEQVFLAHMREAEPTHQERLKAYVNFLIRTGQDFAVTVDPLDPTILHRVIKKKIKQTNINLNDF